MSLSRQNSVKIKHAIYMHFNVSTDHIHIEYECILVLMLMLVHLCEYIIKSIQVAADEDDDMTGTHERAARATSTGTGNNHETIFKTSKLTATAAKLNETSVKLQ